MGFLRFHSLRNSEFDSYSLVYYVEPRIFLHQLGTLWYTILFFSLVANMDPLEWILVVRYPVWSGKKPVPVSLSWLIVRNYR